MTLVLKEEVLVVSEFDSFGKRKDWIRNFLGKRCNI